MKKAFKVKTVMGGFSMSSMIAALVKMYILREFRSLVQKLQS